MDILFYIFAILTAVSAYYITFGSRTTNVIYSFLIFFISVSGFFVLLNYELFALMRILSVLFIVSLFILLKPSLNFPEISQEDGKSYTPAILIISIGIFTAITASLVTSTRWEITPVNYDINSLNLLFSKYLPFVFIVFTCLSVTIYSINHIFKTTEDDNGD